MVTKKEYDQICEATELRNPTKLEWFKIWLYYLEQDGDKPKFGTLYRIGKMANNKSITKKEAYSFLHKKIAEAETTEK